MGYFIDNPPVIIDIITKIELQNNFKYLYLTVKCDPRKVAKYRIQSDSNNTIEDIKNKIDNKPDSENLSIQEYVERDYLYLEFGCGLFKVTGRKI